MLDDMLDYLDKQLNSSEPDLGLERIGWRESEPNFRFGERDWELEQEDPVVGLGQRERVGAVGFCGA